MPADRPKQRGLIQPDGWTALCCVETPPLLLEVPFCVRAGSVCEGTAPPASCCYPWAVFSMSCLSFPVLVSEQPEYARWGWVPLAAPPATTSPSTASSSAPAASPAKPGGSGSAQRRRRGRSVQRSCSSGSKQLGGDPGAGHAALPAHGGKAEPGAPSSWVSEAAALLGGRLGSKH